MVHQNYDAFKQSVEAEKKQEGIDTAIMKDGKAKGKNITLKEVEIEFDDPFVKALWKLTFQMSVPPATSPKIKENPDVDR